MLEPLIIFTGYFFAYSKSSWWELLSAYRLIFVIVVYTVCNCADRTKGVEERLRSHRRILRVLECIADLSEIKSPGNDGLLSCFTFFGGLLVDSLNCAFASGTLLCSLIEKKGKD